MSGVLSKAGSNIDSQVGISYYRQGMPIMVESCNNGWERVVGREIRRLGTVSSTNDIAKQLAAAAAPEGLVVTAEHQTQGRGRRGRRWFAPPGSCLLLSVLLRPPPEAGKASQIALLAAHALLAALDQLFALEGVDIEAGLKWPNDIVVSQRKLAGILAETRMVSTRVDYVVLGIGLNVNLLLNDFPPHLRTKVTAIRQLVGRPVDKDHLLEVLLDRLDQSYKDYLAEGFGPVLEKCRRRCVTLGSWVRIEAEGSPLFGRAVDIAEDGALLVKVGDETTRLYSNQVSIRPVNRAGD